MSSFEANEINRITDLLDLRNTRISNIKNEFDSKSYANINRALDESAIGYFEWNKSTNSVYLSDITLKYSGISIGKCDSYYDLLNKILTESSMYDYLVALESVFMGKKPRADVKVQMYSYIHQSSRDVKVIFIRITEENDQDFIIAGTAQDLTQLKNSISELVESRNRLIQVVNAVPMPIFYVNKHNQIEHGNDAVHEVLGISIENWKGVHIDEYFKFIREYFHISKRTMISKDEFHSSYEISALKNNEQFELLIDEINIFDMNGDIAGHVFLHTDITNRIKDIQRVKKLLKANELLVRVGNLIDEKVSDQELYRVLLEGIIDIISNANKGCILLLDYNNNIYIKQSVGYDTDYAKQFKIPFNDSFAKEFLAGNYRRSVRIKNIQETYGDIFPDVNTESRGFVLESNITSPINVDGKLYGLISIDSADKNGFDDIDLNLIDFLRGKIEISINRFKELSQVIEKSQKDELTGVYNRRFFNEIMQSLIRESTLNKEEFCVAVFDLDELKVTNDTFGHLVGDALIKKFAEVTLSKIREEDVLARIGGDEFIGLFHNMNTESLEEKIKNIVRILIESPILCEGIPIVVKFSYGISSFPADGEQMEGLIASADDRMYAQKSEKKAQK